MCIELGDKVTISWKENRRSREELSEFIGTYAPIVGSCERGDMTPSIKIATNILHLLGISLDFLVGKSPLLAKDKIMLERPEDTAMLYEGS